MDQDALPRALPGLSPAQRVHLEVHGYVLVQDAVGAAHAARMRERLHAIEEEFRRTGSMPGKATALYSSSREYFRVDNLPHLDQCFLDYLAHPRVLAMVEEAIGGEARLEQSDGHIRRPFADRAQEVFHFHRGTYAVSPYHIKGRYHFPFVKALTNLTDLGPDDGGTAVIPGSHKMIDVPLDELIAAAMQDQALIRSVVAPAGSTLVFFESLLHSSGPNRSGRTRSLILGGYTPTMYQAHAGYDPDPSFLAECGARYRRLLAGDSRWSWKPRSPDLLEAAGMP